MELKDVILSTLAEMEDSSSKPESSEFDVKEKITFKEVETKKEERAPKNNEVNEVVISEESSKSELLFLNSIRERLLVLFEGFQAPNNTKIEAKVDMTLNFLEYTLATIDARVELLEKGKH